MNYKITITGDDETIYTHEWENVAENIVFGYTPKLAEMSDEEMVVVGSVMRVVGETICDFRHYNTEDIPTESTTTPITDPDYVEDRQVQELLSAIFGQIQQEVMFAGVDPTA